MTHSFLSECIGRNENSIVMPSSIVHFSQTLIMLFVSVSLYVSALLLFFPLFFVLSLSSKPSFLYLSFVFFCSSMFHSRSFRLFTPPLLFFFSCVPISPLHYSHYIEEMREMKKRKLPPSLIDPTLLDPSSLLSSSSSTFLLTPLLSHDILHLPSNTHIQTNTHTTSHVLWFQT